MFNIQVGDLVLIMPKYTNQGSRRWAVTCVSGDRCFIEAVDGSSEATAWWPTNELVLELQYELDLK